MTIDISVGARVRHLKRNTTYRVVGTAHIQAAAPVDEDTPVVIYQSEDHGQMWVRPIDEFADGRFEALAAERSTPPAPPADVVERVARIVYGASHHGWNGMTSNPSPLVQDAVRRSRDQAVQALSALRPGDEIPAGVVVARENEDESWSPDRHAAGMNTDGAPADVVMQMLIYCACCWHQDSRIIGNIRAGDINRACRAMLSAAKGGEQ